MSESEEHEGLPATFELREYAVVLAGDSARISR
jgi:hypothetical protein